MAVALACLVGLAVGMPLLALAEAPAAAGVSGQPDSGLTAGQGSEAASDFAAREAAWRAAGHRPPFQGVGQTRAELEALAIDLQLFDLCRDRRVTDAELAPLLQAAARLRGGEANCTEVMKRLGY